MSLCALPFPVVFLALCHPLGLDLQGGQSKERSQKQLARAAQKAVDLQSKREVVKQLPRVSAWSCSGTLGT